MSAFVLQPVSPIEALARLEDKWRFSFSAPLSAWDGNNGSLHQWAGCPSAWNFAPRKVTLAEWVAAPTDEADMRCSCAGWQATAAGALLLDGAEGLSVIDANAANRVPSSWLEVSTWQQRALKLAKNLSGWSAASGYVDAFQWSVQLAATDLLERAATFLPKQLLAEAIAAQGVVVSLRPAIAASFEEWAWRRMVEVAGDLRPPTSVRTVYGSTVSKPLLFESALETALARPERSVIVFHNASLDQEHTTASNLVRLVCLVWGSAQGEVCVVSAPVAVVDGLDAIVGHKPFVARLAKEPTEPTIELAVTLWRSSDQGSGPLGFLSSAFQAAIRLS